MKNSTTFAQQAKRIQNKYKGRTDKLSMDSMHRELAALEAQQEALRQQMNLDNSQEMYAWGGPGGYVNQPDNNLLAMGGLIKRADGSYSQKGLWDNIRANKGSGKKPTKQMLEQEKKIKQMAMGGYMYADGGNTKDDNNILPSWDAVKKINDNPFVQTAKIFDPTGISSYPDVIYAGKDLYDNPSLGNVANLGLNVFGALPMIGKFAIPAKLMKAAAKTGKGGAGISKSLNAVIDTAPELIPFLRKPTQAVQDFTSKTFVEPFVKKNIIKGGKEFMAKQMNKVNKDVDRINLSNNLADLYSAITSVKTDKKKAFGGNIMVEKYADGGKLPKEILRSRVESHMSPEEADDYINEYGNGGYTVKRSSDRKGKTHVVIGPDGTKKYFGDSNLGQHPNDPARKKAFYARHKKNLANNPYFRAFARKTWADGGEVDPMNFNYEGIAQAFDYGGIIQPMMYAEGGSIHIDPSKKGTFTAAATKHGKSVQGFASQVLANKENYSPAMVKKANFARNASKWHHAYGGPAGMYFEGPGDEYNGVYNEEGAEPVNQMMRDYFSNRYPSTTNTSTNTGEFQMPYDQMVSQYGDPNEQTPVTARVPFKPGYTEKKERNRPFSYEPSDLTYLTELAGPITQLIGTKKQPVNYQTVKPNLVKYNPNTTADLVRRAYSPSIYELKQQGLGQGSYLNMLANLSSKAGEQVGQANLEGQMKEQMTNASILNDVGKYNSEIQRLSQEAKAREYAQWLKSLVTGVNDIGNVGSQFTLDKKAERESEENKKIMKDYTDRHFAYLDKQLETMKPTSPYK